MWPDHTSVFQALTRTAQNLRASTVGAIPPGPSTQESTPNEDPSVSIPPPRVSTAVSVPETPKNVQIAIQAPSTPSRKII